MEVVLGIPCMLMIFLYIFLSRVMSEHVVLGKVASLKLCIDEYNIRVFLLLLSVLNQKVICKMSHKNK